MTVLPLPIFKIPFSSLIAVAESPKTMLNKSGKNGHSCLVPDLSGNAFSFSLLNMVLTMDLSHMAFIMLRYSHFFSHSELFF